MRIYIYTYIYIYVCVCVSVCVCVLSECLLIFFVGIPFETFKRFRGLRGVGFRGFRAGSSSLRLEGTRLSVQGLGGSGVTFWSSWFRASGPRNPHNPEP